MTRFRFSIPLACVLASATVSGGALADSAKTATAPVKLGANGELLVKLIAAPPPTGLDAKANAGLKAIIAKLRSDDVSGALALWKTFLQANAQTLGKAGVTQTEQWLVRVAIVEPVDDLANPADRVRFAREAKTATKAGLVVLQSAKKNADKSGKSVSTKVVRVAPYQKFQPGTKEATKNLTSAELQAEIDAVKSELDSMGEMSEAESLRLQMAMDRMSKLMSTLSNVLKKMSDTSQSITQNMK